MKAFDDDINKANTHLHHLQLLLHACSLCHIIHKPVFVLLSAEKDVCYEMLILLCTIDVIDSK